MSYLEELFGVSGKTALVTGAATGIGRMAATALVSAGAYPLPFTVQQWISTGPVARAFTVRSTLSNWSRSCPSIGPT